MHEYGAGDAILTRLDNPPGHTRLPEYLRGRRGRVERVCGEHNGVTIYTVAFESHDLWGANAPPGVTVLADLFATYLEKCS